MAKLHEYFKKNIVYSFDRVHRYSVLAEGRVDHTGHMRLQLSRHDVALTKRARFNFSWNTDNQYSGGLKYILTRNLALSGNYDSDYSWGAGISFIY